MKKIQQQAARPAAAASNNVDAAPSSDLAALLDKLDPPSKPRLIFAVDATASRQRTWDMAAKLTSEMFRAVASGSGLETQLIFYRGEQECAAGRWMSSASALSASMARVMCAGGLTQIRKVLTHIEKENQRQKIAAAVFIGDTCEENPRTLYAAAEKLHDVPIFLFQEGDEEDTAGIYRKIASTTGGAYSRFDTGAAARLKELLQAVAAYASGGRQALSNQGTEAARLLLTQMK